MSDSQNDTTEQVWREFSERLRQFVRSRVKSVADVDDILQTVFLRIHERLAQLRSVDRMESWLFQVTRNAVVDHFRKVRTIEIDDTCEVAVTASRERQDVNSQVAGCISALIDHLPEDQRRAVALYEIEGLPQADIAELESISLSGAKSRIQRGRRTLERMLLACCRFDVDARGNVIEYESSIDDCQSNDCRCKDGCADDSVG